MYIPIILIRTCFRVMKGIVHDMIVGEPETVVAIKLLKGDVY